MNAEPKWVVTYQMRKHHAPGQPADGFDHVVVESREGVARALACEWLVVQSIHELGPVVTNVAVIF